jgi:hypothetical protein
LSFWTLEVFPYRFTTIGSGDVYSKPYYAITIKSGTKVIKQFDFSIKNNLISPYINQPYIERIFPGLIPNFPQALDLNTIGLLGVGTQKTALGKMIFYSPSGAKEFCNRKGKMTDATYKLTNDDGSLIATKENSFFYQNQKFDCFNSEHLKPVINISISLPNVKSPIKLKETGQTPE